MGFYLKKSIRLGLVRFNLSGSGVGVSVGIPGLRIGTGPRGNYIHAGRGGVYYRRTLSTRTLPSRGLTTSPTSTAPSGPPRPASPGADPQVPSFHGAFQAIESGDATAMTDATASGLLDDLNGRRRRARTLPLVLWSPVVTFALFLFAGAMNPPSPAFRSVAAALFIFSLLIFLPLLLAAFLWDRSRRWSAVLYSLDGPVTAAYQSLHDAFGRLATSHVIWHVRAQPAVYDRKYSSGASTLLDANPTRADRAAPPMLRTNVETLSLLAGAAKRLCFFPDRLLIFGPEGVGAVNYRDLVVRVKESPFILNTTPPGDARVLDWTWKYVNRGGGPDRRFSNNSKLPIIHTEELHLSSASGLNEVLKFSRPGVGLAFTQALTALGGVLHAPGPAAPPPWQQAAVPVPPILRPLAEAGDGSVAVAAEDAKRPGADFFVIVAEQTYGPHTLAELAALRRAGLVQADSPVCRVGQTGWQPCGSMSLSAEDPLAPAQHPIQDRSVASNSGLFLLGAGLLVLAAGAGTWALLRSPSPIPAVGTRISPQTAPPVNSPAPRGQDGPASAPTPTLSSPALDHTPAPPVAAASPTPLPPLLPEESHATLFAASQRRAVVAHPDLGRQGSPLNTLFVSRYQRLQNTDRSRLEKENDWPERLANECVRELGNAASSERRSDRKRERR